MSSAIRFEAAGTEYLSRTISLPNFNGDYTLTAWVYMTSDTGANATIFYITDVPFPAFYYDTIYLDATRHLTVKRGGTAEVSATGTQLSVGTFYPIGMVGTATALKVYLGASATLDGTATTGYGPRAAAASMSMGARLVDVATQPLDGRIGQPRIFLSAFTPAQMAAELASMSAVAAAVWEDWQTPAGITRANGFVNSRHWTEVGALSDETGPTYLSADISANFSEEAEVRAGGETVIITLTNDTWVAAGATFDGQRQNIINGLTSAGAEANGWNARVRNVIAVTTVVRTSATVVTVTLPAISNYDITAQEFVTVTIPATALVGAIAIVGSPSFAINALIGGTVTISAITGGVSGSSVITVTP